MTRYATLIYGNSHDLYRQASMLAVSLLAFAPPALEIVMLTDHPERLSWLAADVSLRTISVQELDKWRGPAPFSMRQKIEAAIATLPASEALVLLDADVLASRPLDEMIQRLSSGQRFMHKREFQLATSTRAGNRRLWQQVEGKNFDGWQFHAADCMWNSGVLAVRSGDGAMLQEALSLYDALAAAGVRHFATEQLVVGVVLERAGAVHEARQWFTHYWGNKVLFTAEIDRRLRLMQGQGMTPLAAAAEFRANPIRLPAEVRPGKLEKLRRWLMG